MNEVLLSALDLSSPFAMSEEESVSESSSEEDLEISFLLQDPEITILENQAFSGMHQGSPD